MLLLIDNYDSFTYNLLHVLGEVGAETVVHRNDALSVRETLALQPSGIVLSPGPCTPNEAGICLALIPAAAQAGIPLLGVCLGHQALGQAYGGTVRRAPLPVHGKTGEVQHTGMGLFAGLPSPFLAVRYHSLIVERATLPEELKVTAETADGLVMGLQHRIHPLFGVQFHPESIASEHGHALLRNFLQVTRS